MNYLKWHNLWILMGISVSQNIIHLESSRAWKAIKPFSYHNVYISGFFLYIYSFSSIAEARRTPCPKGSGQEELPHVWGQGQPHVWGQGQLPRVTDCDGAGTAKRSYPASEVRGRDKIASEARGGSREEQPHIQGLVAVWAQEGLEELSHVEGQEGRRWGDTPCPR